jgi:hypothetical protein
MRSLTIENKGPASLTYDLSHAPALATGPNTFAPAFFNAPATVMFSSTSVLVPAGGTATVDVTVTENAGLANNSLFGGLIVLTPQEGGETLRVPYSGFKGDYQSIVVLRSPVGTQVNPALRPSASLGPNNPITLDFTNMLTTDDLAFIIFHFDHQVRRLRLEVFAAGGRAYGRVGEFQYLGRNSTAGGFSVVTWDATDRRGDPVPSGQYVIKLTVEKALAEDGNPAHLETWTSPVITVIR